MRDSERYLLGGLGLRGSGFARDLGPRIFDIQDSYPEGSTQTKLSKVCYFGLCGALGYSSHSPNSRMQGLGLGFRV